MFFPEFLLVVGTPIDIAPGRAKIEGDHPTNLLAVYSKSEIIEVEHGQIVGHPPPLEAPVSKGWISLSGGGVLNLITKTEGSCQDSGFIASLPL